LAEQLTLNQLRNAISPEENDSFSESAAPGAARIARNPVSSGAIDPGLQAIIDAWPGLSESTRAKIVAMVRE